MTSPIFCVGGPVGGGGAPGVAWLVAIAQVDVSPAMCLRHRLPAWREKQRVVVEGAGPAAKLSRQQAERRRRAEASSVLGPGRYNHRLKKPAASAAQSLTMAPF